MGYRFQIYVFYGNEVCENVFATHLQWCREHSAVARACQLVRYLDGARRNAFNPFGLGPHAAVGGFGRRRREDLHILRALAEIDAAACDMVEGHDLVGEAHEDDLRLFREGLSPTLPATVRLDPLAQDSDGGFLTVRATGEGVSYAFCTDAGAYRPLGASQYLEGRRGDWLGLDGGVARKVRSMLRQLDGYPVLGGGELEAAFRRDYGKEANIEGYEGAAGMRWRVKAPERGCGA